MLERFRHMSMVHMQCCFYSNKKLYSTLLYYS